MFTYSCITVMCFVQLLQSNTVLSKQLSAVCCDADTPIISKHQTVCCGYIRYVTGYNYGLTSFPTVIQSKALKSRSAGTQFDTLWP